MTESVAIVGAGLIGRAWAMIFARAGWDVRLFDPAEGVAECRYGTIPNFTAKKTTEPAS